METLFFLLTTHFLKCDQITVFLKLSKKEKINPFIYKKLIRKLWELRKNRPIQYVIGKASFFGMDFIVNEKVFIPRPETEELVSWIIQDHTTNSEKVQIFDIGTGSGCISIALKKKLPKIQQIYAIDFSHEILSIARKNALFHDVKIFFKKVDILQNLISIPIKKYPVTIVVSNPPYVRLSEKKFLHPNVFQYEPFQALFVPDEDPLIFYKKIIFWIQKKFIGTGKVCIYFEINQFIHFEILDLMKKTGFLNIKIRKDIQGFFRMIRAIIQIT
ncbi:N5-glutamine methyltransferase family protein [Blattabacterium cuenoti]|uniref:N5-glutamine methyltransferase family protein n=1 Tax=Blattabacterium cuenoti TaxID=1653831 RepID=UPI00293BA06F|nr:HemK/PrmC family methyltransferase [Blattabacterium cuenoti]